MLSLRRTPVSAMYNELRRLTAKCSGKNSVIPEGQLVTPACAYRSRARIIVLHVIYVLPGMKTNVTLKLDADLLREARVIAAEEGRSVSAMLTERLESMVRERKAFDKARRRALVRLREGLDLQWTPPKSRNELHER